MRSPVENTDFEETIDDDEFVDELTPGTTLCGGQYRIVDFLNAGGFGITYIARDALERTVVIKECFPENLCRRSGRGNVRPRSRSHINEFGSIVRLFVQEAKTLAMFQHPNIVSVHQVFEEKNTAYMVLEFIDGRDLLDCAESGENVYSPQEIEHFLRGLLDAVGLIHAHGILHRDISPDNILIDPAKRPVLIDFGAAREEASRKSRMLTAMRVVKDGYSPQEFYIPGSKQGPTADLYALAASFYHLITNRLAVDSQTRLSEVASGGTDPYEPLRGRVEGYSDEFLGAIDQAMAIVPADRIQSANDWIAILDGQGKPAAAANSQSAVTASDPAKAGGGGMKFALVAGVAIAAIGIGGYAAFQLNENAQAERTAISEFPAPPPVRPQSLETNAEPATGLPAGIGQIGVSVAEAPRPAEDAAEDDIAAALGETAVGDPAIETVSGLGAQAPTGEVSGLAGLSAPETAPDLAAALQIAALPSIATEGLGDGTIAGGIATAPLPVELEGEAPMVDIVAGLDTGQTETAGVGDTEAERRPTIVEAVSFRPTPDWLPEVTAAERATPALPPELAAEPAVPGLALARLGSIPAAAETVAAPALDGAAPIVAALPRNEYPPLNFVEIEPATPTVQPQPTADAMAKLITAWAPKIEADNPFTQDGPAWRVGEVNGIAVNNMAEFKAAARQSVAYEGQSEIDLTIGLRAFGTAGLAERVWTLPVVQETILPDGTTFETRYDGNGWVTEVAALAPGASSVLVVGDVIEGEVQSSYSFTDRKSVAFLLANELDAGRTSFTFVVNRDGANWVANLRVDLNSES
ncbi:MAG: protein kinase [Pseudomonadota bacterium]